MDDRTDRYIALALEKGWVTEVQAAEARRIKETVAEVGIEQKIEEIFVKKGFLTPDRARQIGRELSATKVGKYQILEKLGEGGAGIVYKANQEPLERMVAIKVLSAQRTGTPKYLERFMREARIAVTLNHKNIVRGLDYGESDGYHYFVMEYVEGESLYQRLHREGTLSERTALTYALQTVHGLEHAATFGLVHRDIKPENLLIASDGLVKLCDLGLAKPSLVETAQASKDGTTIGTPTYMSPEQIRGRDDADFRSDVYSLGATLYHMLTGRPPFVGASADIIVRQHLREEVKDPREYNPQVSHSAAAVVLKMLAKKPADRYSSLEHLEEDLQSVLEGRPPTHTIQIGGPRPSGKMHVDFEDAHTRRAIQARAKRSKAPLVILLLLLLAGAAAVLVLKPFSQKPTGGPEEAAPETAGGGPVKPATPTVDEKAETAYKLAKEYADRNPADVEGVRDRYEQVTTRFAGTQWEVFARDRLRELERRVELARKNHLERAREAFETRLKQATNLAGLSRYGEAIEEISGYPEGYEDTEYPERAKAEAKRLEEVARENLDGALKEAGNKVAAGYFDEALRRLEPFVGYGIEEIETTARARLDAIREARKKEQAAREKGREVLETVVGAAFLRAAGGEYRGAADDLIRAGEREELVYLRGELDAAGRDIREAERFRAALGEGAEKLVGKVEKVGLIRGSRREVGGRVTGVTRTGLLVRRGSRELEVPLDDVMALDRIRIAFLALDPESADDHAAAALYLAMNGFMEEADAEIQAARSLGRDVSPLVARRQRLTSYFEAVADTQVVQADLFYERERYEEARDRLQAAVDRAPWYPAPRLKLGRALVALRQHEAAAAELEKALELGCDDPEAELWLGEAYFALNRPEDALQSLTAFADAAEERDPRLEAVRQRINDLRDRALADRIQGLRKDSREAYDKEEWDRAIKLFGKLHELSPDNIESLYWRAKAYLERGDVFMGYAGLREFLDADPSGRAANDAKRTTRSLEKESQENPKAAEFLHAANSELSAGRYDEARRFYDLALEEAPVLEDAYQGRGLAGLRRGEATRDDEDFRLALEDFDRVLAIHPGDPLANEGRAQCLYYAKKYDEALAAARKTIAAMPHRWTSYQVAGLCLHGKGEYAKAVEVLTKGIEQVPDEVRLYISRSLAWELQEKWDEALADLKTASGKKPSDAQVKQIDAAIVRIRDKRAMKR